MLAHSTTRTLLAAALAVGCVATAQAQGLYVGGALGHPQYSNNIDGIGGGDDATNGGIGAELYGGYSLSPNFAIEGGLFRLGHTTMGDTAANTGGLFVDGVGTWSVAPQWSLLGSVGVAQARFSTTYGHDWSPGVKFGAGIQYDLSKQVALRVEYERYHFIDAFDSKPNVGEFTAGVRFGF